MIQFFGLSIDTLTQVLTILTAVIVVGVLLLALGNAVFFKIGVRNITRRRLQMVLVVFALMLSTTLLSSVLATGDVMTSAVQSVAVYNWGNIDEIVEGGHGSLGTFSQLVYTQVQQRTRSMPEVAATSAVLRSTNLLVADEMSRQVRSGVTGLAIAPGSEVGFGGLSDASTKQTLRISALKRNTVYLNQTSAQLLGAHPGDKLFLYSLRWPGKRYTLQVAGIVQNANIVGDSPAFLSQLSTMQNIEQQPGRINQIYIANQGGGVSGIGYSNQVADQLSAVLPDDVHVTQIKAEGVQDSQKAEDIFSRIFSLFALFALAIGLLLIFLIFVLLAAERRAEMGMARAIGVQRWHLVLMYIFEGVVYDLLASLIGLLVGVALGAGLVYFLSPVLARFNFPLKLTLQPHSLLLAYCLGVIFTFCSITLSAWLVSRMTIVDAIRDLPESGRVHSVGLFVGRGIIPLVLGLCLLWYGLASALIVLFSLGFSLIIFGVALLLKLLVVQGVVLFGRLRGKVWDSRLGGWSGVIDGAFAALVGLFIMAYWALPFDALVMVGLPRFQGGIEIFFVAGLMMVLGITWAFVANARLLMAPLLTLYTCFPRFYALTLLAVTYPLQRRLRTGLSMVMFSLVVFAMTVMAIITSAMQSSYADINTQTGGYDIQAIPYFQPLSDLQNSLTLHGLDPQDFSAIGIRTTTEVGVLQLGAQDPRWTLYPAQVVSGGFLQGYGLHLKARAYGFASDGAVWQALRTHPNYALIDSSALSSHPGGFPLISDASAGNGTDAGTPAMPPGFAASTTFTMSGVYQDEPTFPAVPLWTIGVQGETATKITVIGVVDNSDGAHSGLYISQSIYDAKHALALNDTSSRSPQMQSYYFKVAPGQDKHALALALGSAYLDSGLETTVLEDVIWQVRGPRILLSNVLLGVVALTLLLGVAALALTGTRAVIERRQQIGMLRAMGSSRRLIQGAFLCEAFFVGAWGSLQGVLLGVILARNIFAANFFEQYQTGLVFHIPWQLLFLIVCVALLASFLGALLPAWQAGRVAPAEAIRSV